MYTVEHGLAPRHLIPLMEIYCYPLESQHHYVRSDVTSELQRMGLIEGREEDEVKAGHCLWRTTERAQVYLEYIHNVPLPNKISRWEIINDA